MSQALTAPKANNFGRLKDLFKFARKYYVPMLISILFLIGSAVLAILTPRFVQTLTNLISPDRLTVGADGMVELDYDTEEEIQNHSWQKQERYKGRKHFDAR